MGEKNRLVVISIVISSTLLVLFAYNFYLAPPNITLVVSATGGNSVVEADYSKITLLSYPVENPQSITFLTKIVNDGKSSARDFHIVMDFQPRDPNWLNPGTVPIETQNYLPCTTGLANECFIGIIPAGDSVIVGFSGSIHAPTYTEVIEQNPRIILSYWYEGSEKKGNDHTNWTCR